MRRFLCSRQNSEADPGACPPVEEAAVRDQSRAPTIAEPVCQPRAHRRTRASACAAGMRLACRFVIRQARRPPAAQPRRPRSPATRRGEATFSCPTRAVARAPLPFLRETSFANVQGIASMPLTRLERRLGELPFGVLERIRKALAFATGMA